MGLGSAFMRVGTYRMKGTAECGDQAAIYSGISLCLEYVFRIRMKATRILCNVCAAEILSRG